MVAGHEWVWLRASEIEHWDYELAKLGGHPLQSVIWGEARSKASGITSSYLRATFSGKHTAIIRLEKRVVAGLGTIAWLPKVTINQDSQGLFPSLISFLRANRINLLLLTPWQQAIRLSSPQTGLRTIWLDLSVGLDQLASKMDPQWQYGVRRSRREGVIVEVSDAEADALWFCELCKRISYDKGFHFQASLELFQQLIKPTEENSASEARLFVAKRGADKLAGALVIRIGNHVHYMWGGVDRNYNKYRAGEAVQWAVIEWAVSLGCTLYDLEGIDPAKNPGTYEFKKKMGGVEIELAKMEYYPLDFRGNLFKLGMELREILLG